MLTHSLTPRPQGSGDTQYKLLEVMYATEEFVSNQSDSSTPDLRYSYTFMQLEPTLFFWLCPIHGLHQCFFLTEASWILNSTPSSLKSASELCYM